MLDRRLYWIWLSQHLPIGSVSVNRLFAVFTDVEDIYGADAEKLKACQLRPQDLSLLSDKTLERERKILSDMDRIGGWVLTPEDTAYPDLLRQIDGFPAVLYGEGNLPDCNRFPAIGVVGTRSPSPEGAKQAYALSGGLAAGGMIVVSGGAVGIDTAAHEGALAVGGQTILVKAAPPEVEYPKQNADLRRRILQDGGAIVTEFAPNLPYYCDFHLRNRVISGMTVGSCAAQAPARSGALITLNLAREQGRDVFALPGNVGDHRHDGTNAQIRKGAMLVTGAADILEEYTLRFGDTLDIEAAKTAENILRQHVSSKPAPKLIPVERPSHHLRVADDTKPAVKPVDASPEAQRLFTFLTETPLAVDELAKRANMTIAEVLALLTELEIFGCVRSTAGQKYSKN